MSLRGQTSSAVDFGLMTFNGAGNGHYTLELSKSDSQNFSGGSWNNQSFAVATTMPGSGSSGNTFSADTLTIFDYTANNVEKAWQSDSAASIYGNNQATSRIAGGRWNSTTPITSIRFFGSEGNLLAGSRISLYGIKTGSGGATVS